MEKALPDEQQLAAQLALSDMNGTVIDMNNTEAQISILY